ncbi:MAG: cell envelope integrity protein TolA [Nitratireductor sp.]|uniref:cell envelope integrity protein TolA n=1 Tax=Nitratireductor sp. TaxID=1872084 RepID=UPI00261F0FEE|nr:cell envelope integrity protein TolA [Nitratireductor sp.]MCV0352328.1 cell envelope integrity protein TolA [Nitratireductor sp.]
MKAGIVISAGMHAALLGFGLVSLSAPRAYEVADVESLPVDIIPIESMTQVQEGDKKAELSEKPAPTPTKRPDPVENAQNTGDNDVDLKTPPTPEPSKREVQKTAEPPPAPKPTPKPEPKPEPEPRQAEAEPTPVPATEVRPEPQPKQDVQPDPAPEETVVAEAPEAESVSLPNSAPVPQSRPQPPKASTAKAPDRKDAEKPAQKTAAKQKSEKSDELFDEVAALLNKDKASGGGAKRSQEQASLGGSRTVGSELSRSEKDAIVAQLESCWSPPVGALDSEDLVTKVRFRLDPSGALDGQPTIEKSSGDRQFDESTTRAVRKCSLQGFNLPSGKYDSWSEVVVNFDPRNMY